MYEPLHCCAPFVCIFAKMQQPKIVAARGPGAARWDDSRNRRCNAASVHQKVGLHTVATTIVAHIAAAQPLLLVVLLLVPSPPEQHHQPAGRRDRQSTCTTYLTNRKPIVTGYRRAQRPRLSREPLPVLFARSCSRSLSLSLSPPSRAFSLSLALKNQRASVRHAQCSTLVWASFQYTNLRGVSLHM